MKTAGLLLAAGRSVRFGPENKLLADLWGLPVVRHAARALLNVQTEWAFAITGDPEVSSHLPEFTCLPPGPGPSDQSASIRAGVAAARDVGADRILVVLGDMPCISSGHLKSVLQASDNHAAVATTDGMRRMPPACFRRPVFDTLMDISGDAGARALLRTLPAEALQRADQAMLADVDRMEDLQALRMSTNALSSGSDR